MSKVVGRADPTDQPANSTICGVEKADQSAEHILARFLLYGVPKGHLLLHSTWAVVLRTTLKRLFSVEGRPLRAHIHQPR